MNSEQILSALPKESPWYKLAELAPPNVDWCEANLPGWISEPANTWSNVAYFILTWMLIKESQKIKNIDLKKIIPPIFVMGLFSFIYHASFNFFTQFFDFLGMFLMTNFFLGLNLVRMNKLKRESFKGFYLYSNIAFSALVIIFYLTHVPIQSLVLIQAIFLIFSELYLRKIESNTLYRNFALSVAFIVAAITFSILDVTRVLCDPDNHFFQGHATWHLLSAMSLFFAFKFYGQFEFEQKSNND